MTKLLALAALGTALIVAPAFAAFPWKAGTDNPNIPNCYIGFSKDHPGVACENPDFDWSIYCTTVTHIDNSTIPPTKTKHKWC